MPALTAFHEVRFPTEIAFGSAGGPERLTEVVTLGSGHEERNSRWADSRRRYNAGYGIRSIDDLHTVIAFFEERRGRLYGFRWRDRIDFSSAAPSTAVAPTDQAIGTGDGATATFQLAKTYGALHAPYQRTIAKPVSGTVRVAVDAVELDRDRRLDLRRHHRDRHVRAGLGARRRRGGDGRFHLRRPGALRYRSARHQPDQLRRRRHPGDSAGRDPALT